METSLVALRNVPIFGGLSDEALAALGERARRVEVPCGSLFFREGDAGNTAFVLERGRVAILKRGPRGDHVLGHLKAGDAFGEVSLLDLGLRSASVRAETECAAIELTAAGILRVARVSPSQLTLIYMNMGRELARRLRAADDRLLGLAEPHGLDDPIGIV